MAKPVGNIFNYSFNFSTNSFFFINSLKTCLPRHSQDMSKETHTNGIPCIFHLFSKTSQARHSQEKSRRSHTNRIPWHCIFSWFNEKTCLPRHSQAMSEETQTHTMPRIFACFKYFWSMFCFFCLKTVFFELLHAKPCRII